jgi:acetoin utilization deacetylase AcuC-like enzyme
MKAFYSDEFVLPLPENHRFPMQKYSMFRAQLLASGTLTPGDLAVPHAARDTELLLAHTREYLHKVKSGGLSRQEIRRIGFPWSLQLVERSRRSVGGTIEACRIALDDGLGFNLSGGTHHAFPDFGAGYCVFNDVAVAACLMRKENRACQIAIVDCDVHQGDGTAAILATRADIFTFSIHGAGNFPFHKQQSDLDIELPDGTQDGDYLAALKHGLTEVFRRTRPGLILYVSGADPYAGDRLGRLRLSKEGLQARDQLVFEFCKKHHAPVSVVMAGGYARNTQDIVDIHTLTIQAGVNIMK